ncbi:MAG: Gfo/Idh/MocA family oxidoreductase [Pseudomonadota bacterium]
MAKFETVNWGIWGTGSIAHTFAKDMRAVPDARLQMVCSRKVETAQAFASTYGANGSTADADAFLADDALDAIYIASPHVLHRTQAERAMAAGKAVLIEKPVAMTAADARAIDAASKAHNRFAMEALWTRFLPGARKARDIMRSGTLGRPIHAEASLHFYRPFDPLHRLFDPKLGGGAMLDLAVYPLSVAQFLLGDLTLVDAAWSVAQSGVDRTARFEMTAGDTPFRGAVGFWESETEVGDNGFTIYCENGALRINRPLNAAPSVSIWRTPQNPLPKIEGSKLKRGFAKLRHRPDERIAGHEGTTGLNFQVVAMQDAMRADQRQHPDNTLETSAHILDIIEQALNRAPSTGPFRQ